MVRPVKNCELGNANCGWNDDGKKQQNARPVKLAIPNSHFAIKTMIWPLLAMLIGAGAILWHTLACVESPMAYSPDGTKLAFVTMEPDDITSDDGHLRGPRCYRLFVWSNENQKDLKVIESSTEYVICAPAFSPDGKEMAYLRVPLLKPETAAKLKDYAKKTDEAFDELEKSLSQIEHLSTTMPASYTTSALEAVNQNEQDLSLPKTFPGRYLKPQLPAELVFRNADTYKVLEAKQVMLEYDEHVAVSTYLTSRPQFSPDGKKVYLVAGGSLLAVDREFAKVTILTNSAVSAAVSPDAKTAAFVQNDFIGLMATDGSESHYYRMPRGWKPSVAGLGWVDNRTLAAVCKDVKDSGVVSITQPADDHPPKGDKFEVRFFQADGKMLDKRIALPPPGSDGGGDEAELAISSDGKHMVVSYDKAVYFMDASGKVLGQWLASKEMPNHEAVLEQPTFRPDGKAVAMKFLQRNNEVIRTVAIIVFSPEGKQISRTEIPAIEAGTTRPAKSDTGIPASVPSDDSGASKGPLINY